MEKLLRAIAITHKVASLQIREKYSLSDLEVDQLYLKLSEVFGVEESMIVVTCNRVELYYFHDVDLNEDIIRLWSSLKGLAARNYFSSFIKYTGRDAIEHLYRTSVGLESSVLGDIQIFGQIKQAYQKAVDVGQASTLLNRLMHKIFFCHKAVAQQTKLKSGAASISYNAVSMLETDLSVPKDANILVIGTGQMGADVASHLSKKSYSNVSITNRTVDKASQLAERFGFEVIPFTDHISLFGNYDVIISTITCDQPVYTKSDLEGTCVKSVIDVSSPRSVSDEIQTLGIGLYNVDQLGKMVGDVLENRKQEIPKVEALIDESINEYTTWTEDLVFSGQVKKFKSVLEELRQQTMLSMVKKMDDQQQELADQLTKKMLQKIVDLPVMSLKTACMRDQEPSQLSESLNELFNMEYKKQVKL